MRTDLETRPVTVVDLARLGVGMVGLCGLAIETYLELTDQVKNSGAAIVGLLLGSLFIAQSVEPVNKFRAQS